MPEVGKHCPYGRDASVPWEDALAVETKRMLDVGVGHAPTDGGIRRSEVNVDGEGSGDLLPDELGHSPPFWVNSPENLVANQPLRERVVGSGHGVRINSFQRLGLDHGRDGAR